MPQQNPITRLEAVAAGLGRLADALEDIYGGPTPNLRYWRNEVIEVTDELAARAAATSAEAREVGPVSPPS